MNIDVTPHFIEELSSGISTDGAKKEAATEEFDESLGRFYMTR